MANCECMQGCPYFEKDLMKQLPDVLKLRQEQYCLGDNSTCARYMVFKALGKSNVPLDLLPSQVEKARVIIKNAS